MPGYPRYSLVIVDFMPVVQKMSSIFCLSRKCDPFGHWYICQVCGQGQHLAADTACSGVPAGSMAQFSVHLGCPPWKRCVEQRIGGFKSCHPLSAPFGPKRCPMALYKIGVYLRLLSLSIYIYMHTVYHIISQLFKEVKTLIIRMGCAPFQICQSAEPRRGPMSFKRLRRRRYPPIPSDQLQIIYR